MLMQTYVNNEDAKAESQTEGKRGLHAVYWGQYCASFLFKPHSYCAVNS